MPYAENTTVPVEKSRAELEQMLMRAGALQYSTSHDVEKGAVAVQFTIVSGGGLERVRQYRIVLQLPKLEDIARMRSRRTGRVVTRSPEETRKAHEQACRERWRALVLAVKAKLVLIQPGTSSFEQEFLSNLLLENGETVYERIEAGIHQTYLTGRSTPLLKQGDGS